LYTLLEHFSQWLKTTGPHFFVVRHAWVVPACQTLHFFGLAMLFGMVGLLDLRMLGVAKRLPIGPINRVAPPWGFAGFILNLITGFLLYAGDPVQYFHNVAFRWKMLFVVLAGLNLCAFLITGMSRKVDTIGSGEDAPRLAKCIAAMSLVLWIGVMYWGRMLPFIGSAF
jgi:hypothetical protein